MQIKDSFLIGTIFKLHGYKGDIKIYNTHSISFDFSIIDFLLIESENKLIPFFLEKARSIKTNIILAKFEDINSEEEAKKILNKKVFLSKNLLPQEIDNTITKNELIGYKVIDKKMGFLGKINYINKQTPQQLIYVKKEKNEFCFPYHEEFVKKINRKQKEIKVDIPSEFLNLN